MKISSLAYFQPFLFVVSLLFAFCAQAANYKVTYFDENNKIVGTGKAFAGIGQTFCLATSPVGDCSAPKSDPASADTMTVKTPFGIDANLFGEGALQQSSFAWLGDEKSPGGSGTYDKSGNFLDTPIFLGDSSLDVNLIIIGVPTDFSEKSISGGWSQQFDISGNPRNASGRFEGVAIAQTPIPAAFWLFGSAFSALGLFGKRKKP